MGDQTGLCERPLDGDVASSGRACCSTAWTRRFESLRDGQQGVNLALNGMMLQHQTQLLRERFSSGSPHLWSSLSSARHHRPESRCAARTSLLGLVRLEFMESRFYYWNLPLSFGFAQNRLLPSFRYREALDNWIFESMREVGPASHTRARNQATRAEMRDRAGMVSAFKDQSQANYQGTQGRQDVGREPRRRTMAPKNS